MAASTYTGDTGDGFAAGQIGDVNEGVVEGSENAGNAEDELALSCCQYALLVGGGECLNPTNLADLGSKLDVLLRTALDLLLGRHVGCVWVLDGTDGFVMLSAIAKSNFRWVDFAISLAYGGT